MRQFNIILCLSTLLIVGCATERPVYPLPRAAFPEPGVYLVQRGDSPTLIAKNLCLSVAQLEAFNPGIDWSVLKIGQRLYYAAPPPGLPLRFYNAQYGLIFFMPDSWRGYSVSVQQLEDERYSPAEDKQIIVGHTPMITLRNPQWQSNAPYQDIPILVFTHAQWDALHHGELWPSLFAGGVMDELWHSQRFVFAMSSRYNAADDVRGYKEVAEIIDQNRAANEMPDLYPE
jgi:hypothetical protein